MKIGIDVRLWSQKGVGRYIRNLVYNLEKIDKNNNYVLFTRGKDLKEFKIQNIARNSKFKIIRTDIPWHSLQEQVLFPQILNHENLDLVHFSYISVPIFYDKSYVLTIHDLIPFHFSTGRASTKPLVYKLKKIGYKFIISKAAKDARKIIVPSHSTKKEVIDHLNVPPEKVVVIYEAVDKKISKQKSGKVNFRNYFLYVGNAYPHKNLENLVKAFRRLENSTLKLVLVGKEDYFYKKLKRKVKDSNIIFFGEASDEQLANLYRNAIAYVAPSLMEGFGLTGLEAMANKCLVLASEIPTHREIYKDAAIYFSPFDVQDLENKMRKVYFNNSNHLSMKIKLGFERSKDFSWQKMARETLKVYESCAGLRSS